MKIDAILFGVHLPWSLPSSFVASPTSDLSHRSPGAGGGRFLSGADPLDVNILIYPRKTVVRATEASSSCVTVEERPAVFEGPLAALKRVAATNSSKGRRFYVRGRPGEGSSIRLEVREGASRSHHRFATADEAQRFIESRATLCSPLEPT